MGQDESQPLIDDTVAPHSLSERSLSAVADYIKSGAGKRVVVLTGAGISTAAGIPDFRSPKTGLYSNLARLNLPYAEAVFDISYFRQHPEPFYVLAKELYPGKFFPTVSHTFIALLAKKGLLHMLFTQNIDCLERRAGVPSDKIIEAHGSFATQRCIECAKEFPDDDMKEHVMRGEVPRCSDANCKGLVKPDIVFFGEQLPKAFDHNAYQTAMADLVLIIGTSLTVYPFASLPDMAKQDKPRVLFNMERVGQLGRRPDDVLQLGSCDDGIRKLADELGWREELEELWKGIVGEEEVQRQLDSQATREEDEEDEEDEMKKLTEGVEAALKLDESDSESDSDLREMIRQHLDGRAEPTAHEGAQESDAEKRDAPEAVASKEKDSSSETQPASADSKGTPPSSTGSEGKTAEGKVAEGKVLEPSERKPEEASVPAEEKEDDVVGKILA